MTKTIVCLVISLICTFLGISSYSSNDALRMEKWKAYYEDYQALKTMTGNTDKERIEMLNKLRRLYPDRAGAYERAFKATFGDLEEKAKLEKEKKEKEEQAQREREEQIAERIRQETEAKLRKERAAEEARQKKAATSQKDKTKKTTTDTKDR